MLEYLALFLAGLLTFASPCVLPLVPTYLALLAGMGMAGQEDAGDPARRMRRAALGFALGLGAVFVLLGVAASAVAAPLLAQRGFVTLGAALLMLVLGLQLFGWPRLRVLDGEARPLLERLPRLRGFWGGSAFGGAFALGWTPCVGPVLGAALTRAATREVSPLESGLALAAYAAGLALPLLAAAHASGQVLPLLARLRRSTRWVQRGLGVAITLFAVWLGVDGVNELRGRTVAEACPTPASTACAADLDVAGVEPARIRGRARLVEFVSSSCTVCERMEPVVRELEQACGATPGTLLRVRVDELEGRALAAGYGVRQVPTFVSVDPEGVEVSRLVGEQARPALEAALRDVPGACEL